MRALVIGSNPTLAWNVVAALGAAHLESDVLCDWYLPRLRFSRHCGKYWRVPRPLDLTSSLPLIKQVCQSRAIDVVIPADMRTTFQLARLPEGELPSFPIASLPTLRTLHDKWALYQLLVREQLPSPRTELLSVDAPSSLTLRFPLIVKPAEGEGGEGIYTCATPRELDELCARPSLRAQRLIAQEVIIGHDVDLSLLADHGRIVAYTSQHTETPDTVRFVQHERMHEVATAIVRATQFHGLAHFDMRVDARDGALYVIECNPRVWGSMLYSVWAGVNFIELGCRIAQGQHLPTTQMATPTERVWHQGVAPRRLLKALLHGRLSPPGMTGGTLASWRQAHSDPLAQLIGERAENSEFALRNRLRSPRLWQHVEQLRARYVHA
jgi:hypothetical protein